MASELKPCPFCSKTMMLRSALWPSEGDADAIIHADPTDCPMLGFSDGSADGSIIEKWNCSLSNEDDLPSDGSCVRCGSVPRNANGLCNTCLDEDAEHLENTRPTPVAPVSPDATGKCGELVTVAWFQPSQRCCDNGWMEAMAWQEGEFSAPVVLRSQAEELLAAERAKKEMLAESLHIQIKRVNELEADNAALTARVKELERVETELCTSIGLLEDKLNAANGKIEALVQSLAYETAHEATKRAEALEAKLAAAEQALKTARPYVEDYDTRRHNTGVDETLTQIDAVLGGKPS
ncbi:hypothetical protein F9K88_07715 [Brucella intermedia]|uniref:hypothetical protein n=2 Tax=Brucella intermedia TaxID=94625 RepID=UPI00124C44E8|nr:hypothetical protein [Brucella intermedia]KAB2712835.1 hypothetical protein F9K88_07715 [Brucella intermedia]